MKKIFLTSLLLISLIFLITACDSEEEIIDDENVEHDFEEIIDEELKDVSESTTKKASVEELYTAGNPLHCHYEGYEDGNLFILDVYIDEERYKMHTTISEEGEEIESNVLFVENIFYTWSTELDIGMKIDLNDFEEENGEEEFDTTEEFPFECKSWNPKNEVFNVPSDVEFMDLGNMFDFSIE